MPQVTSSNAPVRSRLAGLAGPLRWLALLAIGVVIGATSSGYLATRAGVDAPSSPGPVTYTVGLGSLGRQLSMPATASWSVTDVVRSTVSGLVTQVVAMSGFLPAGTVLLKVDERPLILVPGVIPAFRPMAAGAVGRDVDALQRFLSDAGYRVNEDLTTFSAVTATAVRRWHRDLGLPATDTVALGEIVFVPPEALVRPLRWNAAISAGMQLSAGDPLLDVLSAAPQVEVDFGGSPPAQLVPPIEVDVAFADGEHRPLILQAFASEQGRTFSILVPAEPLCNAEACLQLVPPDGTGAATATFTLVPARSGPLVPVAAIRSDAGSHAFVELADGTRRDVSVAVADGGMAIVSGVEQGDVLLLP